MLRLLEFDTREKPIVKFLFEMLKDENYCWEKKGRRLKREKKKERGERHGFSLKSLIRGFLQIPNPQSLILKLIYQFHCICNKQNGRHNTNSIMLRYSLKRHDIKG